MWSYPTSLSTYWAASLCTMKWVTDLVDQAFPLCCQARMRTEQGRSEGDHFPCPPPRDAPPAFGREATLLFGTWVWSIFFPLTCLWTAATSYLPSPVSHVCLSFFSSAADAHFEAVVFGCFSPGLLAFSQKFPPSLSLHFFYFPPPTSNPTLGASSLLWEGTASNDHIHQKCCNHWEVW